MTNRRTLKFSMFAVGLIALFMPVMASAQGAMIHGGAIAMTIIVAIATMVVMTSATFGIQSIVSIDWPRSLKRTSTVRLTVLALMALAGKTRLITRLDNSAMR